MCNEQVLTHQLSLENSKCLLFSKDSNSHIQTVKVFEKIDHKLFQKPNPVLLLNSDIASVAMNRKKNRPKTCSCTLQKYS